MWSRRYLITLLVALLASLPLPGRAQDSWLDGARAWNTARMAIPAAPGSAAESMPQCQPLVRPVETDEDAAVAAQGWRLVAAYQHGWGVALIGGFLNFDAMCRPVPYQQFVFVDGVFAGTLAPEPMYPRTDGALTDAGISAADRLYAVYDRYAPGDPLCCPSGETVVTFSIERTANGPIVTPDSGRCRGDSGRACQCGDACRCDDVRRLCRSGWGCAVPRLLDGRGDRRPGGEDRSGCPRPP